MSTRLSLRLQMTVRPQLVMAGKLLQIPGSELEQFVNSEVADNPALEFANKSNLLQANIKLSGSGMKSSPRPARNPSFSLEEMIENIAQHPTPLDRLAEQISLAFSQTDREIVLELLHRLDDRGFLVMPIENLACELGAAEETILEGIQILHQLEPPGIGARDIRECFLIQCAHLEAEGKDCQSVRRILTLAWSDFLNQQWNRVARKTHLSKEIIEEAREFMRLNFYPHPLVLLETSTQGDAILHSADLIIVPDPRAGSPAYFLKIPGAEELELKISASFQNMLDTEAQDGHGLSTSEKMWIKLHLDRAWMVIHALRQRWETLRRIGEYLIQHQKEFLEQGPLHLKPLTQVTVAQELDIHASTVSRAVGNKTIQLPSGRLMPLSGFFDSSLAAKEAIRLLLQNNSRRLCDREIAEGLRANGVNLSRRTVTKYRREINLNSSRQPLGM